MLRYLIAILLSLNMGFAFQVRTGDKGEDFRIVFQMKDSTNFDIIQIEKSIIIKIEEPLENSKININSSPISDIEIYQTEDRSKSLVHIQTVSNSQPKIFTLLNPKRIVIDIKKTEPQNLAIRSNPSPLRQKEEERGISSKDYMDLERILSSIQKEKEDNIDLDVNYYRNYKGKKRVVVIDPGHGGQDPGAVANGLREKDINLKVAKLLKAYFDRDPRFIAYLTRDDDRYITLYDRTLIALQKDADLFVSIHTNASENPNLSGTYVYTLNLRGATSKLAKMVEERENKTVLNVVKVSANPNVNRIVADMAISHTMTEGLNFAKFVEVNFKNIVREIEFGRIESANFAVLKTPSIPAILFETAFITNERDSKLLRDEAFLDKVARSLYKSTSDYFFKYKNLVLDQSKVN